MQNGNGLHAHPPSRPRSRSPRPTPIQQKKVSAELFLKYLGLSINDVTHLGGRGIRQKVTLFHKPKYLVKWVTRGREGSKISKNG